MTGDTECIGCDGSGWHRWRDQWVACAECNDDMDKPKPTEAEAYTGSTSTDTLNGTARSSAAHAA